MHGGKLLPEDCSFKEIKWQITPGKLQFRETKNSKLFPEDCSFKEVKWQIAPGKLQIYGGLKWRLIRQIK
ncbi:MAG: hypothetical protein RBR63_02730 [Methanosarcina vacuolata]|jgi:hypothetical protein|uniref:hypothetical protein n=1 Tax=Methanosarcina sp. DH1 TaxID=2605695 RepID=UPI001E2DC7D1|nr:hypothetical protein [Methanosarcina sp. DH1]MCC4768415.1 hypothetical protein [Methanosarcina sp. DH1]MDY0129090.1 hypothetical protein [Methanosarcina vacuolata]